MVKTDGENFVEFDLHLWRLPPRRDSTLQGEAEKRVKESSQWTAKLERPLCDWNHVKNCSQGMPIDIITL